MDLDKIKKIDSIIQQWLSDEKLMTVNSELIFPKLVEEGLYGDSKDEFNIFIKDVRKLTRKEKSELLNIRMIGVDIGFRSRY